MPKRIGPKLKGCFCSIILPWIVSPYPGANFISSFKSPLSVIFLGFCNSIIRVMVFCVIFLKARKAYYPTEVSQLLKEFDPSVVTFLAPESIRATASMYSIITSKLSSHSYENFLSEYVHKLISVPLSRLTKITN